MIVKSKTTRPRKQKGRPKIDKEKVTNEVLPSPPKESPGPNPFPSSDGDVFPLVFVITRKEPSVMIRIGAYLGASLVWEPLSKKTMEEKVFLYLFSMEFCSWFEERKITDSIINLKSYSVYTVLSKFITEGESYFLDSNNIEMLKETINKDPNFSKLTYRAFRQEVSEARLLKYIADFVLTARQIQRKHVAGGRRKRSSEDSSGNAVDNPLSPKYLPKQSVPSVRELEGNILQYILLPTSERKTVLEAYR